MLRSRQSPFSSGESSSALRADFALRRPSSCSSTHPAFAPIPRSPPPILDLGPPFRRHRLPSPDPPNPCKTAAICPTTGRAVDKEVAFARKNLRPPHASGRSRASKTRGHSSTAWPFSRRRSPHPSRPAAFSPRFVGICAAPKPIDSALTSFRRWAATPDDPRFRSRRRFLSATPPQFSSHRRPSRRDSAVRSPTITPGIPAISAAHNRPASNRPPGCGLESYPAAPKPAPRFFCTSPDPLQTVYRASHLPANPPRIFFRNKSSR